MDKYKNSKTVPESLVASVKSRFFAQYWGTKTIYVGGVGKVEVGNGGWDLKHPDFFLQLKSLSNYTDEDAIAVEKIWRKSDNRIEEYFKENESNYKIVGRLLIKFWGKEEKLNFQNRIDHRTIQHITEYLRSKGYALPFMEYSVDDLISFGWVQLL